MRSLRTVKAPKVVREGNSNPLPLGMGSRQSMAIVLHKEFARTQEVTYA